MKALLSVLGRPSAKLASTCWINLWLFYPMISWAQGTTDCMLPPGGMIAWWPGDGGAGDSAGTNNGVLKNGAIATAPGLVDEAFSFDGLGSYVLLPNLVAGRPQGTVEGWFKLKSWDWDSAGDGRYLWSSTQYLPDSGGSWDGVDLGTHHGFSSIGGELMFGLESDSGWHWALSGVVPQTNVWYHVAGTWGAEGIKLYVNGLLRGSDPYTGPIPDYLQYSLIGRSSWPNSVTDGIIDEFAIFSRALSPTEIAALYAAGSAGKCKRPVLSLQVQSQPGTMLGLTWTALAGKAYQLQYKTNLAAGDWKEFGLPITATNTASFASDVIATDRLRVYRVLLLP